MPLSQRVRPASSSVQPPASRKSSFRPDVQGLRAFAVVAVVLGHITGYPSGGFVGVDIFFVISGFLITGLLLREHEKTGRISFSEFYKRRAKRILPASILVLIVTSVSAYLLLPKTRGESTLIDAVWSLFFAGNWRFASTGTDYFQEGVAPSSLQHFWSLAVEEQFYFVWPWLMLGIFWMAARAGGRPGSGRIAAGVAMLLISFASFAWAASETANDPTVAYFSTFSRAWELGIGALIAVAAPFLEGIRRSTRNGLAWLGLVGLFISVILITEDSAFPAPWAALPVLSTALVIAAGTGHQGQYLWPLANRYARYIGDISYSLYLWHWPVAILLVAFLESGTFLYYASALALSAGLAIGSYHFVEDPIRRMGKRTRGRERAARKYAGMAAVTLVAVVVCGIALDANSRRVGSPFPSVAAQGDPCRGAAALDPTAACDHSAIVTSLDPSVDAANEDEGNAFRCWADEGDEMQMCSYGSEGASSKRVAIVGDSHAASLVPALTADTSNADWTLDTFVGNGCQWRTIDPGVVNCGKAMQEIQAQLTSGEPYDVVLTTASRTWSGSNDDEEIQRYINAWRPVIDRGTQVIVIADVPSVDAAAIECISRLGYDPAATDCSTSDEFAFAETDALIRAAQVVGEVPVVDMTDLLCTNDRCPMVVGGTIVYRDAAAHLTATYVETMAPYLTQRIQNAMAIG